MKKIISTVLILCVLCSMNAALAADAGQSRAVIGADLTDEQVGRAYSLLGVEQGTVSELKVSNAEEREYLSGVVDESVIGTKSISCVYIEVLPEGSGVDVSTQNITWCSEDMYINALVTSGISDAKVVVAAPWEVSGTAALTGIYKAYEDISGEQLNELAKLAGTKELVVTAELADEINSYDALMIVNEIKLILEETKQMTDEQVAQEIRTIAAEYNVSLTDGQIEQLVSLCRSLEKLNTDELKAKVESVQKTVKDIAEAKDKAGRFVDSVKSVIKSVIDFFSNIFNKFKSK